MRKNTWLVRSLWGAAAYLLLLSALTAAESGDPDASIQSFSDALWYSVVTLSTVGYGDLYPVTPLGKGIGLLFVLLSVGALAVLVGSVVSLLTGKMLPRLQLRALRHRKWYVFSQWNDGSGALAMSLAEQDENAVLLFPASDREKVSAQLQCHFYPETIAAAVAGKREDCTLFFMDDASGVNYAQALQALSLGFDVYCRTEQILDRCPETLHLFNRYECCAREYWQTQGLRKQESVLILIGDGRYAQQLLEQGLAVNVFGAGRQVQYHVFGDWEDFRRNHPQLGLTLALDGCAAETDSLHFHTDVWNSDRELLCRADRIILCSDDDRENAAVLRNLRRYFPVSGAVHLRSTVEIPGEETFGTHLRIYTAENILASRLTSAARAMHSIYCASSVGAAAWEQLSEFTRQSNIAAADHLLVKIRLLLEDETIDILTRENCAAAYAVYCRTCPERIEEYQALEHLRWMRFHSLYSWRYGAVRDDHARVHPMMVPYEVLAPQERAKDLYAWQLLEPLAQIL